MFILVFFSSLSFSQPFNYMNGNKLYEFMNGSETESALATMYVLGVTDSLFQKCDLRGKTGLQLNDIVKIYLQNNPEKRDMPGSLLIQLAFSNKINCKK